MRNDSGNWLALPPTAPLARLSYPAPPPLPPVPPLLPPATRASAGGAARGVEVQAVGEDDEVDGEGTADDEHERALPPLLPLAAVLALRRTPPAAATATEPPWAAGAPPMPACCAPPAVAERASTEDEGAHKRVEYKSNSMRTTVISGSCFCPCSAHPASASPPSPTPTWPAVLALVISRRTSPVATTPPAECAAEPPPPRRSSSPCARMAARGSTGSDAQSSSFGEGPPASDSNTARVSTSAASTAGGARAPEAGSADESCW
jgi:hypothetical protein